MTELTLGRRAAIGAKIFLAIATEMEAAAHCDTPSMEKAIQTVLPSELDQITTASALLQLQKILSLMTLALAASNERALIRGIFDPTLDDQITAHQLELEHRLTINA